MHEKAPPLKVILGTVSAFSPSRKPSQAVTHMLEYMPGTWASSSLFGSGSRNLSGFHSNASSPQYSLLRFRLRKLTNISVPRGTATSCSCDPSVAVIGVKRGRTMSLDALPYVISVSRRSLTKGLTIGRSSAREHSWKKKRSANNDDRLRQHSQSKSLPSDRVQVLEGEAQVRQNTCGCNRRTGKASSSS
jgi:hypothetical protein